MTQKDYRISATELQKFTGKKSPQNIAYRAEQKLGILCRMNNPMLFHSRALYILKSQKTIQSVVGGILYGTIVSCKNLDSWFGPHAARCIKIVLSSISFLILFSTVNEPPSLLLNYRLQSHLPLYPPLICVYFPSLMSCSRGSNHFFYIIPSSFYPWV